MKGLLLAARCVAARAHASPVSTKPARLQGRRHRAAAPCPPQCTRACAAGAATDLGSPNPNCISFSSPITVWPAQRMKHQECRRGCAGPCPPNTGCSLALASQTSRTVTCMAADTLPLARKRFCWPVPPAATRRCARTIGSSRSLASLAANARTCMSPHARQAHWPNELAARFGSR